MKWLTLGFTLFILAIIVLADQGLLGPLHRFYGFPNGDKAGHFILYGILAFVLVLYYLSRPHANSARLVLGIGIILAILIGLEEWSQARFPTRTMDGVDLVFSYAGVITGSLLAYRVKK